MLDRAGGVHVPHVTRVRNLWKHLDDSELCRALLKAHDDFT